MTSCRIHIWILIISFFVAQTTIAQGEMGLAHGNYNVTEGIRINPAAAVDPLPYFDFHVVGGYFFVDNNALYAPDEEATLFLGKFPSDTEERLNSRNKHAQLEGSLIGPGFNYPIGKNSIGFSTAIRNSTSVRNMPHHVAHNYGEDWDDPDYFNTNWEGRDFRINSLTWQELGIHVGRIVYQEGFEMINVAVNVKYLVGSGGLSFKASNFDYNLLHRDTIIFNNFSAEYTATVPGQDLGKGWGLDLGFVYKKMLDPVNSYVPHDMASDCEQIGYKYKIGVSILDLGFINFNKSSFYRKVENASLMWTDFSSFDPSTTRNFVNGLDEQFAANTTESATGYKAYLPASISGQFDYNLGNNYFVNATALLGLRRIRKFGAESLDYIAFTPRYELPHFEVAAPIAFNRFLHPGVGFAFRFWNLSMGTNNIIPYFVGDIYSLSAYFHLKFKFLKSDRCRVDVVTPIWRVSDCTAPRIDPRTKKKYKKANKSRLKRDNKRRKRYSGS